MEGAFAHIAWSMVVRYQRDELASLASSLGVAAIFLKSTWSDDYLYGGKGVRRGVDIDLVVDPSAFGRFADALTNLGYRRVVSSTHRATSTLGDKEWLFVREGAALPVDLHRAFSEFFPQATSLFLARSKRYLTESGPIWSLCEEDQVLYFAMHGMNHRFFIDDRHFQDVLLLCSVAEVSWTLVRERARELGMEVPVALVAQALDDAGALRVPGPGFFLPTAQLKGRFRWAKTWLDTTCGLRRLHSGGGRYSEYLDSLYRMPRLRGRPLDGLRVGFRYSALRIADKLWPSVERFLNGRNDNGR